ncbi:hypothetical protein KO494_03330 [Lacinutrix sp. C3R15]|uniref:toxin-antitoxin system YwqK family antitoxin n=1 Tax=Flavobacteriaceae TaxID=49546 RepID=UPI001C0A418B|nr:MULTISPECIES: hypothetical protein [Flavobacteriaceae]MBU2938564.1 hypothetical protein [Lacinutrix sp. C3R15]MDO6621878.1 hypothetical protein [Oceanihabitans sp. 1_MG-2023]
MKIIKLFLCISFLLCIGCNSKTKTKKESAVSINTIEIEANIVHKDSLVLNGNKGIWYYNKKPFNGYAVKYHNNNTLKEKTGFYNGKKEGVYRVWYETGVLKLQSFYNQNVLQGSYKAYWNNGNLASESNYVNGKKQGVERKWFYSGKLSKKRNLLNDKEDGLQQAWLENGKLYVNYEAKNGRIFGMRRANSCYQLKDEVVIRKKK